MFLALSQGGLIILSVIAFVLVIGLIIALHEGGHFFFAKRAGILCHEFSLGMGPVIYQKQFGETKFCIRAIPIGGFVSMAGEDVADDVVHVGDEIGINIENNVITEIILDEGLDCHLRGKVEAVDLKGLTDEPLYITISDDFQNHYYTVKRDAFYIFEKGKRLQITPYDRCFDSKTILERFLTIFAGPLMNMVLAIFLYLIVAFSAGVPNYSSNEIGGISKYYPAEQYLVAGDKITAVNGNEVDNWNEFSLELDKAYSNNETTVVIKIDRNGSEHEYTLETFTYIASIGISNIQAENLGVKTITVNNQEITGLELGNVAIRYKDKEGTIKKGDVITKVKVGNNEPIDIESWSQLIAIFKEINIEDIRFEYYSLQENNTYTRIKLETCKVIEPYTNEVLNNQRIEKIQQMIGVTPTTHFDLFGCIKSAFGMFWDDFTLIFRTLKLLIAPSDVRQIGVSDLSSFVGIFSILTQYVSAGILPIISFAALLSVNIGVMNLLPIPALDGGRLVFLLYELVTRRKPSKKVEATINNVFFILLMLLFLYITFNDILRLF